MTILDCRTHDDKAMQDVCELITSLDKRQPLVDAYLSLLNAGVVSKDNKDGEKKPADRKLIDDEDSSKAEDSEAVKVEPNPKNKGASSACSQAKGKNNSNKKKQHKKGKGGRKK